MGYELLPFQEQVVDETFKRFNGRALFALEMGCGKTPIAIRAARRFVKQNALDGPQYPIVIVCPASLRLNWLREVERFWPDVKSAAVIETKTPLAYQVMILSYEQAAKRFKELMLRKPVVCIADESHYLKNPKAARTRAMQYLFKSTPCRLLLTGTPILNRPIELWAQLDLLGQSFGTYWQFAKRYCNAHQTRFGWDVSGASNIQELNYRLNQTCMIRKLKSEVLSELPDKTRSRVSVGGLGRTPKGAAMAKLCRDVLRRSGWNVGETLNKLRSKEYNFTQCFFEAYSELGEAKAQAAGDVALQFSEGSQLVVFAHHRAVIDVIYNTVKAERKAGVITGDTKLEERQRLVDEFQAGKLEVLVLSITAASTGLTLTAASNMLIAELPLTPGLAFQAEDRIHRIGQKNAALIRYLCADNTIDDSLWRMISNKAEIAGAVIDGKLNTAFSETEVSETNGYWAQIEDLLNKIKSEYANNRTPQDINFMSI